MKTICNDFSYRNEHYTIVYDGKFYMSVNHKFIGNDGRLTKELHFNDGLHTAETFDRCIHELKRDLDIENLISHGYTKVQAFSQVLGIPLDIAEKIFSL